MFVFGAGVLMGTRTDISGATPVNFGLVNEVDIDISLTNKMLYGQSKYPIAVGQGTAKSTGKAKMARWSALALSSLFFGATPTPGQLGTALGETGTVPSVVTRSTTGDTPTTTTTVPMANTSGLSVGMVVSGAGGIYAGSTIASLIVNTSITLSHATTADVPAATALTFTPAAFTITVANSATWTTDQGVVYALTGEPLEYVSTSPVEGEYTVTAGVYTFGSGDAGALVLLNYNYTPSGTTGSIIPINNTLLGVQPTFSALFYTSFEGTPMSLRLFKCISNKFSFGTKLEDFALPEIDFDFMDPGTGIVGELSIGDNF
jgi:hypothetical protein